jgi:PAS domain S-box-containing protein
MSAELRGQRFQRLTPVLACATAAVALVVIAAWLSGGAISLLNQPILVVMKFNTASCLLLAGIGLAATTRPSLTVVAGLTGATLLGTALLILLQYLLGVNLGIDQLFVTDPSDVPHPGRPSPVAAAGLAGIGLGLLLAIAGRTAASQLAFFLAAASPITILGGYLYNAPRPGMETMTSIVAAIVALAMLSICLGGLFLRGNSGLMRVVVSQSRAGSVARILMPLAAAVPVVAGMVIVAAGRSGLVRVESGTAMLVSFCAIFFAAAVWITSNMLWQSELVQAESEQALRVTRGRLDAALIASEIGTYEWDIVADRLYADRNLAAMFQVSESDANGGPVAAYYGAIHPEDVPAVEAAMKAALAEGRTFHSEYRLQLPDGRGRWVLSRGHLLRDEAGAATRMTGVVLDISEQRRVEAQLRESEHRRRMALESAELGMWTIHSATMTLVSDARLREIFGVQGDTLAYEDAITLIHPDDRPLIRRGIAAALRETDPELYDVEHRVIRADGAVRWVHAKGRSNVSDTNGEMTLDGTLADITARKHAEEEREHLLESERTARSAAERAGRIKDEFLATLSHEIRTPLSAILGWTRIMRKSQSVQDHAAGLEVIERNALAQKQMIEDLLDMSSIISGKVRLDVQEIDLAALIHVGVDTVRPTADAKELTLDVKVSPRDTARMYGDASRLQQVLWNLLTNAIKFTPRGGRVEVSLHRRGSMLEMCVCDSGEGISPEFLPFVFDRFRQADASTTRRHGGLGLGLSIVRQIAELHGGTVRVDSAGIGLGSTFTISLPVAAVLDIPQTPLNAGFALSPPDSGVVPLLARHIDGIRVLVVDDEADAREMILRLLQEDGAVVTAADCAQAAMERLEQDTFDVLVSDIGMPREDGYSLIRRVRELPPSRNGAIHAIALTAFARTEDRVRAINAGFTVHLSKPVEPLELITMIAAAQRKA